MSDGRKIKRALPPLRNVPWALAGFGHDFSRYVRYGGRRGQTDRLKRGCYEVKTYRRPGFRLRCSGSAWDAAGNIAHPLVGAIRETVGIEVLRELAACSPKLAIPSIGLASSCGEAGLHAEASSWS